MQPSQVGAQVTVRSVRDDAVPVRDDPVSVRADAVPVRDGSAEAFNALAKFIEGAMNSAGFRPPQPWGVMGLLSVFRSTVPEAQETKANRDLDGGSCGDFVSSDGHIGGANFSSLAYSDDGKQCRSSLDRFDARLSVDYKKPLYPGESETGRLLIASVTPPLVAKILDDAKNSFALFRPPTNPWILGLLGYGTTIVPGEELVQVDSPLREDLLLLLHCTAGLREGSKSWRDLYQDNFEGKTIVKGEDPLVHIKHPLITSSSDVAFSDGAHMEVGEREGREARTLCVCVHAGAKTGRSPIVHGCCVGDEVTAALVVSAEAATSSAPSIAADLFLVGVTAASSAAAVCACHVDRAVPVLELLSVFFRSLDDVKDLKLKTTFEIEVICNNRNVKIDESECRFDLKNNITPCTEKNSDCNNNNDNNNKSTVAAGGPGGGGSAARQDLTGKGSFLDGGGVVFEEHSYCRPEPRRVSVNQERSLAPFATNTLLKRTVPVAVGEFNEAAGRRALYHRAVRHDCKPGQPARARAES